MNLDIIIDGNDNISIDSDKSVGSRSTSSSSGSGSGSSGSGSGSSRSSGGGSAGEAGYNNVQDPSSTSSHHLLTNNGFTNNGFTNTTIDFDTLEFNTKKNTHYNTNFNTYIPSITTAATTTMDMTPIIGGGGVGGGPPTSEFNNMMDGKPPAVGGGGGATNSHQRRVSFDATKDEVHEFTPANSNPTTPPSSSKRDSGSSTSSSSSSTDESSEEFFYKLQMNAKRLISEGNRLLGEGEYDDAILQFKQAVVIQESAGGGSTSSTTLNAANTNINRYCRSNFEAYHGLGNAYYHKQDYDTCLVFYLTAIRILRWLSMDVDLPTIEGYDYLHFEKDDLRLQDTLRQNGIVTYKQIQFYESNISKSIIAERAGDELRSTGDYTNAVKHYKTAVDIERELFGFYNSSPALAFLLRKVVLIAGLKKRALSSTSVGTDVENDSTANKLDWDMSDRIKRSSFYENNGGGIMGMGGMGGMMMGMGGMMGGIGSPVGPGGASSSTSTSKLYHSEVSQAIRIGDFLYSEFFYQRAMEEYTNAAKLVKPLTQEDDLKTLGKRVDEMSSLVSSNTKQLDSWVKDMKFTIRNTIGVFRSYIRNAKGGGGGAGGGGSLSGGSNHSTADQDVLFKEVYAISETIHNMEKDVSIYFEDLQLKLRKVQDRSEVVNGKIKELANLPTANNLKSPPVYDSIENLSATSNSTSGTGGSGNPGGVPTIVEGNIGEEN